MDEPSDGFGRKIDFGDSPKDDTENCAITERDEDNMPREKFLVKSIGESAATIAVDFSWDDLEKHSIIIAHIIEVKA